MSSKKPSPIVIDGNPIAARIQDWAERYQETIQAAYTQKGGWEGWAQVELTLDFMRAFGSTVRITREDPVYVPKGGPRSQQYADIMIDNKEYNIIELKCEGLNSGPADFLSNVKVDIGKIENNDLKSAYRPAKVWVCGISVSYEAAQKMEKFHDDKILPVYKKLFEMTVDGKKYMGVLWMGGWQFDSDS